MAKRPSTKYRKQRELYAALVKLNEFVARRFNLPVPAELAPTESANGPSPEALVGPSKAAKQLGISTKTLANWRSSGVTGLKHVQVGGRIFYRQSDLHEYVSRNVKGSTSERRQAW